MEAPSSEQIEEECNNAYKQGYKAGEEKVVEFVNRVSLSEPAAMSWNFRQRWQAFLKSERIEL